MASPGDRSCGARFRGRPVHPILTDFPIVMWTVSVLWDVISLLWGGTAWALFAFWSIAAGLVMSLPTIAAGLMEYFVMPRRGPAPRTAVLHAICMAGATLAFGASLFLRPAAGVSSLQALLASLAGLVLLGAGGWLGGELVFKFGIGRKE